MQGVIYTKEPGLPPRRIGKLVMYGGALVYNFDGVTIYRKIQAIGVAECILVLMLRENVREVHYTIGTATYIAKRDDVIEQSFRYDPPGARLGYFYLGLKHWTVDEKWRSYAWVPDSQRIDLEWVVDAPAIAQARARILAARPKPAVQMEMWA